MSNTLTEEKKSEHLSNAPLFTHLSKDAIAEIASITTEKSFQPSEVLATEGESGSTMFIIVTGNVRVTVRNKDGDDFELAVRGPGDHLGEMAILSEIPRTATLTAVGSGIYLELTKEEFSSILSTHLETSLGIIRELINRLDECDDRLRDQGN